MEAGGNSNNEEGDSYWHQYRQEEDYFTILGTATNSSSFSGGFPILLKSADSNGCNVATHKDDYHGIPRIAWSVPATANSYASSTIAGEESHHQRQQHQQDEQGWCGAIGAPSYKSWKDHRKSHKTAADWDTTFVTNGNNHPWPFKIPKAVWRGATTFNKALWGRSAFEELPRSRLVQEGLDNPHLIDAGFHKLVGKFERYAGGTFKKEANVVSSSMLAATDGNGDDAAAIAAANTIKEAIPMQNMMNYKAIIDIDGNSWSSRFGELLCTNSVVIKITPEHMERFQQQTATESRVVVLPNVHYLPATIENITAIAAFVVDPRNDRAMRNMVRTANEWCRMRNTERGLADEAMEALEDYRQMLDDRYGGRWKTEWEERSRTSSLMFGGGSSDGAVVDDLVECNV